MQYWVHNLDPVAIHLRGEWGIRYYGLAYLLAFALAWGLLSLYARAGKSPLKPAELSNAMTALIVGVLLGGRIGYILLYAWSDFVHDPLMLMRVWEGGMASHGGFVGVTLALLWISRRQHMPLLRLGDLIVSVVPLGLLLGRIANFINGELWGKVTAVPWAIIFPLSAPPGTPPALIAPRHPSQLYEAGLEGVLLLIFVQWRFWRSAALTQPGRLSGEFLVLYALARLIGEHFREPDAGLILGLSRGSFYSLFLILAGVGLMGRARWHGGHGTGARPSTQP